MYIGSGNKPFEEVVIKSTRFGQHLRKNLKAIRVQQISLKSQITFLHKFNLKLFQLSRFTHKQVSKRKPIFAPFAISV